MSDIVERIRERNRGTMMETVGLRLLEINDEHSVTEMEFRPEVQQLTGLFHTGALLTLADSTATSLCLFAVDPTGAAADGRFPLAVQLSANLIRNTGSGKVTAEARLLHRGRTTMVAETKVRDDAGRLLAVVTTTHVVLGRTGTS